MKQPIDLKVQLAFRSNDISKSDYTGWLAERININSEKRLLKLDLDMILDPFVNRPGKQWWAGEHVGKFLHAATYSWLYSDDKEMLNRINKAVNILISTQLPNGYMGTYEGKDQFGQGDGLLWDGPVWDVWTHKYNLIGLLCYYQATQNQNALEAAKKAAELMYLLYVTENRSLRLASAHMGMAATSVLEPIATLYRLTGKKRYLEFCHVIIASWEDESDPETWMYEDGCQLLNSLLEHGNVYKTANRKAYEMLSNLVGLLELYRVDPDERYYTACKNAWDDIVANRLYLTGTTSYFEQFTQDDRLPPGKAVGEGCVTVTWLQLTIHMLELTGDVRYADEIERTIYNALPAAQSPINGEVSYFSPLVGKKQFNQHDLQMDPEISCCSSSIPRGLAIIPTTVSGILHGKPTLLQYVPGTHVIPYISSKKKFEISLNVSGDYPKSGDFKITILIQKSIEFSLILRVPDWATRFEAMVDGITYKPQTNRFMEIKRLWSNGDTLSVKIPLSIRRVEHPDKTMSCTAFVRGPQVLASDTLIQQKNAILDEGWWGDSIYKYQFSKNGQENETFLVPFADAGQRNEEYTVLHEGLEPE